MIRLSHGDHNYSSSINLNTFNTIRKLYVFTTLNDLEEAKQLVQVEKVTGKYIQKMGQKQKFQILLDPIFWP